MIPDAVSDIRFRHFRYVDSEGRFVKVRKKVRGVSELEAILSAGRCTDAYYSTSRWLNPHRLGRRSEQGAYDALFLGNDLFFDIDFKPFSAEKLERARQEALKLLCFLDEKRIRVKYIAFSGSKGFHVSCESPENGELGTGRSPLERELAIIRSRSTLVREIGSRGITIDAKITTDTRRIVRIPGTVNSNSGYLCRLVSREELGSCNAKEIMEKTPRMEIQEKPGHRIEENGARTDAPGAHVDIKSNVPGTKRNIVILSCMSYLRAKSVMSALGRLYSLGPVFLAKRGRRFFVISPAAIDIGRALKISGALSKADHARYLAYGYTTFPADCRPLFFREGENPPRQPLSRSHLCFLNNMFGSDARKGRALCGKENILLSISVIE